MTRFFLFLLLCLVSMALYHPVFADESYYGTTKDNEVGIWDSYIEQPLGRILLIRKDSRYCAVKFTKNWTEIDEEEKEKLARDISLGGISAELAEKQYTKKFTTYEIYHNFDEISKKRNNIKPEGEHIASWLPMKGLFRPFIYQPGDSYIICDSFKLTWSYKNKVCFHPPNKTRGEFGFELAPTPWSDISQVNISDPRIKWYRYDDKRQRVNIPIDKLWPEAEAPAQPGPTKP